MSPNFEKVEKYYEGGLWSVERVQKAIGKWITLEEYLMIVGKE